MALGLAVAEANQLLDALVAEYPWIKMHTGDPGASATANAAGNTTRKQVTWGAASGGVVSNSAIVTWSDAEVNTSETYSHASFWTASSAGTFGFSGTVSGGTVASSGQAFNLNVGDVDVSFTVAA